jgi:hypothetical protein
MLLNILARNAGVSSGPKPAMLGYIVVRENTTRSRTREIVIINASRTARSGWGWPMSDRQLSLEDDRLQHASLRLMEADKKLDHLVARLCEQAPLPPRGRKPPRESVLDVPGKPLVQVVQQRQLVRKPGIEDPDRRPGSLHELRDRDVGEALLLHQRLGGVEDAQERGVAAPLERRPQPPPRSPRSRLSSRHGRQ